ncbi:hypothetical protein [Mesorhizobium sp. M1403]|uniref:hypothetical protein n=1 Tax=Mesorhizobium sp. M1403 TaxID=2957097 RepID=UPI00333A8652
MLLTFSECAITGVETETTPAGSLIALRRDSLNRSHPFGRHIDAPRGRPGLPAGTINILTGYGRTADSALI